MGGKQNHKAKSVSFYKSKQIKSDKKWKEGLFLPVIHNSVWNSAPPFQHHFVRIDVNGAKGLAVWSCFDNPFYVDMVHTVRVLRVAAIVSVAGEEAHHTLVRPNDCQGVSVIPGQAYSVRGFRVNGKMAITTFSWFLSENVRTSFSQFSCSWLNPPLNWTNWGSRSP